MAGTGGNVKLTLEEKQVLLTKRKERAKKKEKRAAREREKKSPNLVDLQD